MNLTPLLIGIRMVRVTIDSTIKWIIGIKAPSMTQTENYKDHRDDTYYVCNNGHNVIKRWEEGD